MSPEEKKLLEDTLGLAKENNEMLRAMRRSMRIQHIMNILYWVFIVGSAIGAYYILQPYIDQLTDIYSGAKSNLDSFNSMFESFGQ